MRMNMNIKRRIMVLLLLLLLSTLAGCGGEEEQPPMAFGQEGAQRGTLVEGKRPTGDRTETDGQSGQGATEQAAALRDQGAVVGEVESVVGNEVTLALLSMQEGDSTDKQTGETATYLLPVGMRIGTGDFSSVTEGMVIALSMDEGALITAVSILSQ